jgi:hypothetical protein
MEAKDLKKAAAEWYGSISRNSILRVTKSKKFPSTVAIAVGNPQGKFLGYVWVKYHAPDNALLLLTEIGTHAVKPLGSS